MRKKKNTAQFTFAAVHKHNRNVRKKQLHREWRKKYEKKKISENLCSIIFLMNLYNRICRVNALMSFNDNFRLLLHFDAAVAFFSFFIFHAITVQYILNKIYWFDGWMDGWMDDYNRRKRWRVRNLMIFHARGNISVK